MFLLGDISHEEAKKKLQEIYFPNNVDPDVPLYRLFFS
jgi:hypothetical protein